MVAPTDVGKVIGKGGPNAQALRSLLSAFGMKLRARYDLALRIRIPYWVIVRSRRGCGKVGKRTLLSCFSIACFALAAESACDCLGCSMPLLFKLDGADVAQS